MGKRIILAIFILIVVYILYKNLGSIFLPSPSQSNSTNPFQTNNSTNSSGSTPPSYKDGSYTGTVANAFYGNIQVQAIIAGGKIKNVQFLQFPNDNGTSIGINQQADPMLTQEAIQAQNANVDIVSGASDSSQAFIQSLQSALDQAKKS